jgi:cytochrome oxidase assembly protein ShyY1
MLRVVLSRRWLTALAMAVLFAVACYFLGQWQWHRHEDKAARADRIERHYSARPVQVSRVMPRTGVDLPRALEWTRVTATGRYDAQHVMLVRNRPNNGVFGYEVVVPLRLTGGADLLVDRGWIPNGRTAAEPSRTPATPAGEVTVTGWLRLGEPSFGRKLPPGQLASVNLTEAQKQSRTPLYGAYLIGSSEAGAPGANIERPQALARPDIGQGPHLAYALQWWLAAPVGFVLVLVGARREHLDNQEAAASVRETSAPENAAPEVDAIRRSRDPARLVKVRKTRIWDEEDE